MAGSPSGRSAFWRRRPTCPAPTPTSCATWVPSCSGAGSIILDYAGTTLRENLGLPRPLVGAWKLLHVQAAE
jgi:hypothetical protein